MRAPPNCVPPDRKLPMRKCPAIALPFGRRHRSAGRDASGVAPLPRDRKGRAQIIIRLAEATDAPLLPAVERSAGEAFRAIEDLAWVADGDDLTVERYAALIADGASWVAVDGDGAIIGFLCAEQAQDELHIWELAVMMERQRAGIGRCLLDAALAWARAAGVGAVTLTTFRDIAWNAPFYRRHGFVTLDGAHLSVRLAALLAEEEARGLPAHLRCAMRRATDA